MIGFTSPQTTHIIYKFKCNKCGNKIEVEFPNWQVGKTIYDDSSCTYNCTGKFKRYEDI